MATPGGLFWSSGLEYDQGISVGRNILRQCEILFTPPKTLHFYILTDIINLTFNLFICLLSVE